MGGLQPTSLQPAGVTTGATGGSLFADLQTASSPSVGATSLANASTPGFDLFAGIKTAAPQPGALPASASGNGGSPDPFATIDPFATTNMSAQGPNATAAKAQPIATLLDS